MNGPLAKTYKGYEIFCLKGVSFSCPALGLYGYRTMQPIMNKISKIIKRMQK